MLGRDFGGLLRAAQRGDDTAFATLYRDAQPALLRYLRVASDPGTAEDVAADYCRQNAEGFQLARCLAGLAELALARGDAAACLDHAAELLALVEPAGMQEFAAEARRWRARAARMVM